MKSILPKSGKAEKNSKTKQTKPGIMGLKMGQKKIQTEINLIMNPKRNSFEICTRIDSKILKRNFSIVYVNGCILKKKI